jgi:heme exporter protein A
MFEASSLSCRRSARLVFRDVSFRLMPGDLLQVIGANGSGKSTLLRGLAGLLPFAGGGLCWQGASVSDDPDAHRARLHYVGHLDALKSELTGDEMLSYWQLLWPEAAMSGDDLFGINAFRCKPLRYLSAGQKRRLSLSRLMLGDAPLWLLDEPTTALDSGGQDLLIRCFAAHRAKGGIVIAAVHHLLDMPQVQTLAMPGRG